MNQQLKSVLEEIIFGPLSFSILICVPYIVLRKQNGDIVKKTTYMTYGNTFADVLEQLERYVCCSMEILTNTHTQQKSGTVY